jgi:predicted DNA-binding protein
MTDKIKYSQRLEIRLSVDEMETLNEMSNNRKISKSSFIRTLIEKERKACDQRETDINTLKDEITELKAVIVSMRETEDKRTG